MSAIPTAFDPLGAADGLPAGYERVESVYKPAGAYWLTDIPVRTGFDMTLDANFSEGGTFDVMGTNEGTNLRLYYFWANAETTSNAGWAPARRTGSDITTSILPIVGRRATVRVRHSTTRADVWQEDEYQRVVYQSDFSRAGMSYFFGAFVISDGTVRSRKGFRFYELTVVDINTMQVFAHFIPVRRYTADGWEYGVWDTVARKELEKVGTMEP